MTNWQVVGRAFKSLGSGLLVACENIEVACESDPEFYELYSIYAMMLDTLKSQMRFADSKFDEIDERLTDERLTNE